MPTLSSQSRDRLKENLWAVNQEIKDACDRANRSVEDVRLIAVSKGQDYALIKEAYGLYQRDFGESYAQELSQKISRARRDGLSDICWHFIGAIQTNKLKWILEADVIHSISSLRHAALIDGRLRKPLQVFCEVNLDKDPGRQGFFKEEVVAAIEQISSLERIRLAGLMTILPRQIDASPDHWFGVMRDLREQIISQGLMDKVSLSMGMSDDFVQAIEHGANFIRVGTKIFGPRSGSKG